MSYSKEAAQKPKSNFSGYHFLTGVFNYFIMQCREFQEQYPEL